MDLSERDQRLICYALCFLRDQLDDDLAIEIGQEINPASTADIKNLDDAITAINETIGKF